MKKLLLILIVFVSFKTITISQTLELMLVNDLETSAKTRAATENVTNPVLLFAGFTKLTIPILNVPSTFDITTGKANMWVFIYKSKDDSNIIKGYIFVKAAFLGIVGYPLPDSTIAKLPIDKSVSLDGISWKNSDVMASTFNADAGFMDFYNAHTNPDSEILGVAVNSSYDFITKGKAYWVITISQGSENKICGMDAVAAGAISCQVVSDVAPTSSSIISIAPNPAQNEISISMEENELLNNYQIFNLFGEKVWENNVSNISKYKVKLDELNSGVYFIKINGSKSQYIR